MNSRRNPTYPIYTVECELNGETKLAQFEALNPGSAFFKCLRKYNGCKLLRAYRSSALVGERLEMIYDPPSTVALESACAPAEVASQLELPI